MLLIDSNFLIAMESVYPQDIFPSLWDKLAAAFRTEPLVIHESEDKELTVWNSTVSRWNSTVSRWYVGNTQGIAVRETDEAELEAYTRVASWVEEEWKPRYRSQAVDVFLDVTDSWLVASALAHGDTIITNEKHAPQSVARVKIPDVATHFGVECLDTISFFRLLKWKI